MATNTTASRNRNRRRFRRRRRIAVWLTKFFGWLMLMLVLGAALIVAVGFVAYKQRVSVVNNALATLVDPYSIELQSIDFEKLGEARVKGITLTPKFADRELPLAYLEEVLITYDIDTVRNSGKLKSISIRKPTLQLDEKMFEAFTGVGSEKPEKSPEKSAPKFDLSVLSRFTDSIEATDGRLLLDLPWHPPVTASWEFSSGPIDFDEKGILKQALELDLRDLRFGEDANSGHIDRFYLKTRLNRDLSHIEVDELLVDRPGVSFTPAWLAPPKSDPEPIQQGTIDDPTGLNRSPETGETPLTLVFNDVKINEADLRVLGFDEATGRGLFPDVKLSGSLSLEDIALRNGLWHSRDEISLTLDRLYLGNDDAPLLDARPISISVASLYDLIEDHRFDSLEIGNAEVSISDKSLGRFEKSDSDQPGELVSAALGSAKIGNGTFEMKDYHPGGAELPEVSTKFSGTLRALNFDGTVLASPEAQTLTLENFVLRAPGTKADALPVLKFAKAETQMTPDDFNRSSRFKKLHLEGPEIRITDESLGHWAEPVEKEAVVGPSNRAIYSAEQLQVDSGLLIADTEFANQAVPKVISNFSLSTREDSPDPMDPVYQLKLTDIRLRNHARVTEAASIIEGPAPSDSDSSANAAPVTQSVVEEEVLTIQEVSAEFTAAQLQRDRHIEKIRVDGATLNVGHGLKELVREDTEEPLQQDEDPSPDADPEPTPQAAVPAQEPAPTWRIGEIEVTNSQVRFEALVPQIEGLQFALETKLTDVPLSLEGLLSQNQKQKIELSGIEIKDPYDSFITVAYLPTIFVEFSLAGLAKQEINSIDLIGPSLYVGQGLFWWIEYQRKFREQNEGASVGVAGENSPIEENPDWTIKKINASAGKIVIAPTGVPLGMVPFPFNATTNMEGGQISLKLSIPGEKYVYQFPAYQVDLYGLSGDVDFNVPLEDVNNNLVQTFKLNKAVWKKYEAKDLYLTVTFDADGVYGQFGGEAYDGYAEGEFNYYLSDEGGKWDGWISGTNLDTGPLFKVIVPDNFLMDGRLSLKLVSKGDGLNFGETTGTLTTETPGWFDITKLDKIIEELPDDWTNLQRSLSDLALIGLKKFEYDKGTGSLYFLNRDGDLKLRMEGPYGSRELNIHVHDQRSPEEKAGKALTSTP